MQLHCEKNPVDFEGIGARLSFGVRNALLMLLAYRFFVRFAARIFRGLLYVTVALWGLQASKCDSRSVELAVRLVTYVAVSAQAVLGPRSTDLGPQLGCAAC